MARSDYSLENLQAKGDKCGTKKFLLSPRSVIRSTVLDQDASFGIYFSLRKDPIRLRDAFETSLWGFLACSARYRKIMILGISAIKIVQSMVSF